MDAPSKAPTAYAKWHVLYPLYLNKGVSAADGRRVPLSNAVDAPKAEEMAMVCKFLKLECLVEEGKTHPADVFCPGRVRVRIRLEDGTPCVPDIANKHQLLLKMGALIPQLKTRSGASSAPQAAQGAKPAAKNKPTTKKPTAKPGKKK